LFLYTLGKFDHANFTDNFTLMGLLSVGLFAIASTASAAAVTVATDLVESHLDYTQTNITGAVSPGNTRASGAFGLTALAGANYVENSNGTVGAAGSATITNTAGFGGVALDAGIYTLKISAGRLDLGALNRDTYGTFEAFLQTTGGTALPSRVVTDAFTVPAEGSFDLVEVQYTVPSGSGLIGQAFTFGFDYTFDNPASGFLGAFDNVSVHFDAATVIPEPSSLMLTSLAMIGLAGVNRRRK